MQNESQSTTSAKLEQLSLSTATMSDLKVSRLIAGFSTRELSEFDSYLTEHPRRIRHGIMRNLFPAGFAAFTFAALFTVIGYFTGAVAWPLQMNLWSSLTLGWFACGVALVMSAVLDNFSQAPFYQAYARLVVLGTRITQNHPLLYEAHLLRAHPVADRVRTETLKRRGFLIGADVELMHAALRSHELQEQARPASEIADSLQR